MQLTKVYVEVVASFREDGLLLPKEIIWEDGRHFEIDRVSDIRPAASMKVGGQGDRYTIWLDENFLFCGELHHRNRNSRFCRSKKALSASQTLPSQEIAKNNSEFCKTS